MKYSDSQFRLDVVDRVIAFVFVAFTATACGKDSTSPPTPNAIAVSSGASQSATVNTALGSPVIVEVTSASGQPVSGVAVTFTPTAASGSVSATQVTTDQNGLAQVTWTLGTLAGTDSLTATAGSLATVIVATATPGAPATITAVAGNQQAGTAGSALGVALSVKVTDSFGNVVPNAVVQWSDDAGGSFSATTTVTDANGVATVSYTLGPSTGTNDITAALMSNGVTLGSTTFTEMGD